MSSFTQLLYHFVWCPVNRAPILTVEQHQRRFMAYLNKAFTDKNCFIYTMHVMPDHLHILAHIHQSLPVSKFIGEIKRATSLWIKKEKIFSGFSAWQTGYGAFTVGYQEKEKVINYIVNQEIHHKKIPFEEEYKKLIEEHGISFDEKYLWE